VPSGGGAHRKLAALVASFSWAPDSRRIAYVHYDGASQAGNALATVDIMGANRRFAIDATPLAGPPPVWSPDGTRIAFTGVDPKNPEHTTICVVGANRSGLRRLA
jgi:Tol biopolymer transport system component